MMPTQKETAAKERPEPSELLFEGVSGELKIPLLLQSLEATKAEDPESGEEISAYEATFKAVLPETYAAEILHAVREHKLIATISEGEDGI